jgi:hypothetical protein
MRIRGFLTSLALAAAMLSLPAGAAAETTWDQTNSATCYALPAASTSKAYLLEVKSLGNRVHVMCGGPNPGGSWWTYDYAVPTSDWMAAFQFTSLASQVGSGKFSALAIEYSVGHSESEGRGCLYNDCRRALRWALVP